MKFAIVAFKPIILPIVRLPIVLLVTIKLVVVVLVAIKLVDVKLIVLIFVLNKLVEVLLVIEIFCKLPKFAIVAFKAYIFPTDILPIVLLTTIKLVVV